MKKCFVIGIILVFVGSGVVPSIAQNIRSHDEAELKIMIHGPRTMTIKNVGNAVAFNVRWDILVKGGFIIQGRSSNGEIGPLEPGQEITVGQNKLILGFGRIEITYAALADNAPMVSATLTPGLLLFFFFKS
jgi:hypothetical protein